MQLCCEVSYLLPDDKNVHLFKDPKSFRVILMCSQGIKFHSTSHRFCSAHRHYLTLRSVEVPHACDSGASSIFFGSHKSAGHSSLVHSGLGSHREDSGAERAAASHCSFVLVHTVSRFWP